MIVIMAGLPGTGKSTLCRTLAEITGGVVLEKDVIRAALFPPERVEYSAEQDDFCQDLMIRVAGYLLAKDSNVVIFFDGRTFSRRYQMQAVIDCAEGLRTPWRVIECVCAEETARKRLVQDSAQGRHPAANRSFALYLRLKAEFEAIAFPKLVVDTERALEEYVTQAREFILA